MKYLLSICDLKIKKIKNTDTYQVISKYNGDVQAVGSRKGCEKYVYINIFKKNYTNEELSKIAGKIYSINDERKDMKKDGKTHDKY